MSIIRSEKMNKRIFNWDCSKNRKFEGRDCPDFDFVKGCQTGLVIWWNETQFCIDLDKLEAK